MNKTHQNILLVLFLGCYISLPLFFNLTKSPIPAYDEARTAINAYEMHINGNYIVTHFNHQPEMWNTKPPLLTWVQVFTIKILGFNELALRLPSALAGLFTCFLLLWFSIKHLKNKWIGILSVMVLVTYNGYIRFHVTRTGDYDALLILFMTAYVLSYYCYLHKNKLRYFIAFFIFITLAALTKGIAALLFLPALLLYTIYKKQLIKLLKQPSTYIGIISFLFFAVGYYFLRDHYNPGFIKAVWQNELGGRFTEAQEGNSGNFWFYCNARELLYWMYYILPAAICLYSIKPSKIKSFAIFSFLIVTVHFLIISSAATKLDWYFAPSAPFLSLIIGVFLFYFVQWLVKYLKSRVVMSNEIATVLVLLAIFFYPYYMILDKVTDKYLKIIPDQAVEMADFLQNAHHRGIDLNGFKLLKEVYAPNVDAYMIKLAENDMRIFYGNKHTLIKGDKVIFWQNEMSRHLHKYYATDTILIQGQVQMHSITGVKE